MSQQAHLKEDEGGIWAPNHLQQLVSWQQQMWLKPPTAHTSAISSSAAAAPLPLAKRL
jgi:hypothetical protein